MYNNSYYNNELYHFGVKGMKWGKRKMSYKEAEQRVGKVRTSNGMVVAPSKNAYIRTMRKVAANRAVEGYSTASYRGMMKKRHSDTVTNRLATAKGEQHMRKEAQALREYDARVKDMRKGTGTKYTDKAVRKNKLDDAYEKIQSDSTRLDRFIYNNATRKKAAKYVVDNNMTVAEANKKAKGVAMRNTVAFVAAYGAITYTSLKSMK